MTNKATQNAIKAFEDLIYALEVARVMTEKSVAAEAQLKVWLVKAAEVREVVEAAEAQLKVRLVKAAEADHHLKNLLVEVEAADHNLKGRIVNAAEAGKAAAVEAARLGLENNNTVNVADGYAKFVTVVKNAIHSNIVSSRASEETKNRAKNLLNELLPVYKDLTVAGIRRHKKSSKQRKSRKGRKSTKRGTRSKRGKRTKRR